MTKLQTTERLQLFQVNQGTHRYQSQNLDLRVSTCFQINTKRRISRSILLETDFHTTNLRVFLLWLSHMMELYFQWRGRTTKLRYGRRLRSHKLSLFQEIRIQISGTFTGWSQRMHLVIHQPRKLILAQNRTSSTIQDPKTLNSSSRKEDW